MRSLSSVGLALSIVFGCLLLALLAELYYLLWCKKRRSTTTRPDLQTDYSTPATRELLFILCCSTNPSSPPPSFSSPKPIETQQQCLPPPDGGFGNVVGPGLVPRFLFTIMEETVEEMESEDGVSTKGKSLNDLFLNMESGSTPPFLTPRASPSLFTPPFTPLTESCNGRKEEVFFESSTDAEFNRMVRSSPLSSSHSPASSPSPLPRFKFLRDAEEKLHKRKQVSEISEAEEVNKG
ncbi:F122 [Hirschfeldia incana]|nr:F122 [Hirschfeldia incana]